MSQGPAKHEEKGLKEQEKLMKEKEARLTAARSGSFACSFVDSSARIGNARSYVVTLSGSLSIKDDGLDFGKVAFYRPKMSDLLGRHGFFLNDVFTIHTVPLFIQWNDVKGCFDVPLETSTLAYKSPLFDGFIKSVKGRALVFDNHLANREEWIGFGIIKAEDDDIQEIFLDCLREHGVSLGTQPATPQAVGVPALR